MSRHNRCAVSQLAPCRQLLGGVVLVAVGGLMVWKALDAADKIGSVIGALGGVIGLGLVVYGVMSTRCAGPAASSVSNSVESSSIGGDESTGLDEVTGDWPPLGGGFLDPTDARAVTLQEPFVERVWLLREIETFVGDHDRGYFIIQADAGTGKTAFALWYSGFTRCPSHRGCGAQPYRATPRALRIGRS